ncbi:MAG TPA: hypothetical protein VGJ94_15020 [Syntrophorhabdaceae bacterium]
MGTKKGVLKRYRVQLISLLVGAGAGYILAHPYTMLIYAWAHAHQAGAGSFSVGRLSAAAFTIFQPVMLPMALSFALIGAIVGFLAGTVVDKKRRLYVAERETERRRAAFETLHQLMVTLSHYLLNANTIIGGMVRHCQRRGGLDKDLLHALETINEQAIKVEAVVRALQKVEEIKTASYTADSTIVMLDVTKELESELAGKGPEERGS